MARRGTELETRFTGDDREFEKVKTRVVRGAKDVGTAYEKASKRAQGSIGKLGDKLKGLKGLGTLVAGGAVGGVASSALAFADKRQQQGFEVAKEIDKQLKQSERLGIGFETYQRQANVFERAGLSADQYFNVLSKLDRKAAEAAEGNEMLSGVFEDLNLNVQEFTKLKADEKIRQLATAFRGADDPNKAFERVAKIVEDDAKQLRDLLAGGGSVMRVDETRLSGQELILERDAKMAAVLQDELLKNDKIKRANLTRGGFGNLLDKASHDRNVETGFSHRLHNFLTRGTFNDKAAPETNLRQSDLDEMRKDMKRTADGMDKLVKEAL